MDVPTSCLPAARSGLAASSKALLELALHLPSSIVRVFAYIYVCLNTKLALLTYVNMNYQVGILTKSSKCLKNGSSKSLLVSDL